MRGTGKADTNTLSALEISRVMMEGPAAALGPTEAFGIFPEAEQRGRRARRLLQYQCPPCPGEEGKSKQVPGRPGSHV